MWSQQQRQGPHRWWWLIVVCFCYLEFIYSSWNIKASMCGSFSTLEFAKTWGSMKSNRSEEMNYEKISRAMR